jgi:hypothetical protein
VVKAKHTLKKPELVQLDKVLHKWFTAVCSKGKHMIGPMIIEEAKYFCNAINVPDKCTFS